MGIWSFGIPVLPFMVSYRVMAFCSSLYSFIEGHNFLYFALHFAVHSAVHFALHFAVQLAVHFAMHFAVHFAVHFTVHFAVYFAVHFAVHCEKIHRNLHSLANATG